MKRLIIIALAVTLILPSCKKSHSTTKTTTPFTNSATITGPNLLQPVCGANFIIIIHGVTDSFAQFNTLPAGSGINLATATFPINVNINWHHNTGTECDTAANIISIDAVGSVE